MRPVCAVVAGGLPSESAPSSCPGPASAPAMSLLHALGPVRTWLGQELEKCGVDAVVYTRYVLGLLLHDGCDYDLQEQENDIFLGWEKGACKKWGKSKRKCSDLTLEEMKKQAAVQCLRSASDESSGIETLVEELCSRLKDLQTKQEEKTHKKLEGASSPEAELSPTAKDQVEMYYEAFPPLSEKPVCLQEIVTVWNRSPGCAHSRSSSSSTAPAASTATSSPKDCPSEAEAAQRSSPGAPAAAHERPPGRGRTEKEHRLGVGAPEGKLAAGRRPPRHKPEGKARPRTWSSGSSEAGSSSGGPPGELAAAVRCVRVRHRSRDVRSRKGRGGPGRLAPKHGERAERGTPAGGGGGGVSTSSSRPLCRRGKRPPKELGKKEAGAAEGRDPHALESRTEREYKEEPLWYTEPIAECFVPLGRRSKLETTYRSGPAAGEPAEELAEAVRGLYLGGSAAHKAYLPAGTFVDGHFVEMPAVIDEGLGLAGPPFCPLPEDSPCLDDIHLSELTHFYEVDIDQSMLDPGASEPTRGESRILSMIRRRSREDADCEAECCIVLDGLELQGERAIWADAASPGGAEGFFPPGLGGLAQVWESRSSSSADADGESLGADSPARLSPLPDGGALGPHALAGGPELFPGVRAGSGADSCFSVFEVQCGDAVLPFPLETLHVGSGDAGPGAHPLGKTQSRLLIWTKNSAFEEHEHCSSLSTRTCSPWSHSEEARSDSEARSLPLEEPAGVGVGAGAGAAELADQELLDFLRDGAGQRRRGPSAETPPLVFKKRSKLESVCGIRLERQPDGKAFGAAPAGGGDSPRGDGYRAGVIKDIWAKMAGGGPAADGTDGVDGAADGAADGELFPPPELGCRLDAEAEADALREPSKAVQRSEYHLWDGRKEHLDRRAFEAGELSEVDGGDYTTPSRPWDGARPKESAFILGGVYGELRAFASGGQWAVVPPGPARGGLLQCAAAAASDVVTIAGTDVFMAPGSSFAPGHRPLWRPCAAAAAAAAAAAGESGAARAGEHGLSAGFSFVFHEDLLGARGSFQVDDPGLEYPFPAFGLRDPFSQVLHVECAFEPEGIAAFSPGFKPKSILCADPAARVCGGAGRTQYRAIRISPRTHFRPISAAELSPGGASESELESERDEAGLPVPPPADAFEDPQADLRPLEEDAEREGPCYGKSELESGRFLPRLRRSGMEKSAQTSLDSQEEPAGQGGGGAGAGMATALAPAPAHAPGAGCKAAAQCAEEVRAPCSCRAGCQLPACEDGPGPAPPGRPGECPVLSAGAPGASGGREQQAWWETALYPPPLPAAGREATGETGLEEPPEATETPRNEARLVDFNRVSSVCEARCAEELRPARRAPGLEDGVGSGSGLGSGGAGGLWAGPGRAGLFSRTHL